MRADSHFRFLPYRSQKGRDSFGKPADIKYIKVSGVCACCWLYVHCCVMPVSARARPQLCSESECQKVLMLVLFQNRLPAHASVARVGKRRYDVRGCLSDAMLPVSWTFRYMNCSVCVHCEEDV